MIKQYHFDEFQPASKADWNKKLHDDLPEHVIDKISSWSSDHSLSLDSYYTSEDLPKAVQKINGTSNQWSYLQHFNGSNPKEVNVEILDALMNGAGGLVLNSKLNAHLTTVLRGVDPAYCTIGFNVKTKEDLSDIEEWLEPYISDKRELCDVLLYVNYDHLNSQEMDLELPLLDQICDYSIEKQGIRSLGINGDYIQEAGGSAELEITFALSKCVFYINHYLERGYAINQIIDSIFVKTSVGTSYFLEMAKVRTLKVLLQEVIKQYGIEFSEIYIHAATSSFTKSKLDQNTNMLRCTSEAMSAVLGGVDALSIDLSNELPFSDRIARNISNLLLDESHFSQVANPISGSYYIERLISDLSRKSWARLQVIERKGGYMEACKGYFQSEIKNDLEANLMKVNKGKRNIVGVNNFGNQDEKLNVSIFEKPSLSLALKFEEIRLIVEKYVEVNGEENRPSVCCVTVGEDLKMITARTNFVTNFFTWAGFSIVNDETGEVRPNSIIVFCGSDDDYKLIGENTWSQFDGGLLLGAGQEQKGLVKIKFWINAKSNKLEVVGNLLTELGIKTQ